MKKLILFFGLLINLSSFAADEKVKMYFKDEDLTKVIEIYSKASNQKFVVDPGVRGKVSIFIQEPVTLEEAFNQLSSALAINGYGISKQGDTMIVGSARNIQRNLIEVSTERPSLKPERMVTWIYTARHMSVTDINSQLRVLQSRDGEMAINSITNQLVISDWTANIQRIADILKEVDKPIDPSLTKIIETSKKEMQERKKESQLRKKEEAANK